MRANRAAVLYAFAMPSLGLLDQMAPNMFSNQRFHGGDFLSSYASATRTTVRSEPLHGGESLPCIRNAACPAHAFAGAKR